MEMRDSVGGLGGGGKERSYDGWINIGKRGTRHCLRSQPANEEAGAGLAAGAGAGTVQRHSRCSRHGTQILGPDCSLITSFTFW